jgi:DNA polymerase-3 subunit alpha
MTELKELFYQHHGTTPVMLTLYFDNRGEVDIQVLKDMSIRPCSELFAKISRLCGPHALRVKMRTPETPQRRNGKGNGNGRAGS